MADLTGHRLGKYELVERLGRGGMAEVYKAYQPGMDRFVAVKVMHSHLAESEDFLTRFRREAQLVGQLRHPHIMQVIDFDAADEVYYMVMEYIRGQTLKFYIQQKGALTTNEALRIVSKLSDALDYAHGKGMIHRDIKPANVMFTENNFAHPVLTDFGIARIIGGETQLTASGAFIGTPAYISPEAARGEVVDARSDIYSMGIMLYEMVTGKVPFDADTPFAVIMKHVNEPLPSPRQFNINVTDTLERVLLTTLAKDPAERYQTAGALKAAVDAALQTLAQERPTDTGADTTAYSGERTVSGQAVAEAPTHYSAAEEAPTRMTGPRPAAGRPRWQLWLAGMVVILLLGLGGFLLANSGSGDDDQAVDGLVTSVPTDTLEGAASFVTRGDNFMAQNDYVAAIGSYTQAIRREAENPAHYVKRGRAYAANEDYENALADFENALIFDENHVPAHVGRAEMLVAQADYNAALNDLVTALQLEPDNLEALLLRGIAYRAIGEYDLALSDFNAALAQDSRHAPVYLERGRVYLAQDDTEAALEDFEQAIALDETASDAYYEQGRILLARQDYPAAIEALSQALQHNRFFAAAYTERGMAYYLTEEYQAALDDFELAINNDDTPARAYIGRGLTLHDLGNYEGALEAFSTAIEQEPNATAYIERGTTYYELGDYEAARDDFQQAIDLAPSASAYLGLGQALVKLEAFEEALTAFNSAVEADEALAGAYLERAWLQLEQLPDLSAAQANFEQVLALDADNIDALLGLSDIALEREIYETALTRVERVLALDADNAYAYFNQGLAYAALDQYEDAQSAFTQALANDYPHPAVAYLERAYTYQELDNHVEAIVDFTNALDSDSTLAFAYLGRGLSHLALGHPNPTLVDLDEAIRRGVGDQEAVAYRARGEAQLLLGEYEAALSELDAALAAAPDDLQTRYLHGVAARQLADYTTAIDDLTTVIEGNYPDLAQAYLQRGIAFADSGVYDRALRDFQVALDLDDTLAEAYYQQGLVYQNQDQPDRALMAYNQALELDDTLAGAYFQRGELYRLDGDYEQAIADYDQAIAYQYSDLVTVYTNLGRVQYTLDEVEAAIRSFSRAIDLAPEAPSPYYYRGLVYLELGDYARAADNFSLAIENDYQPLDSAYNDRGVAYTEMGDNADALADFQQAATLDATDPLYAYNQGVAYYNLGQYEQAVDAYDQALNLGYDQPARALSGRGNSYFQLGDYEAAEAAFNEALRIDSRDAIAYYNRGRVYHATERYGEAIDDYNRALEAGYQPVSTIHFELAQTYYDQGDDEQSLASINRVLDEFPNDSEARLLRARIHQRQGDPVAALQDLSVVIDNGTEDAEVYYLRGTLYADQGQHQQAISDFDRAIVLDTRYSAAYLARAEAYIETDDLASAQRDLTRLLLFDEQNPTAHRLLGDILYQQEDFPAALARYRRYVELTGSRADLAVLNRIARLEDELGDTPPATPAPDDDQANQPPVTEVDAFLDIGVTVVLPSDDPAVIERVAAIRQLLETEGDEAAALALLDARDELGDNAPLLGLQAELHARQNDGQAAHQVAEQAIAANPDHPAGYLVMAHYYGTFEHEPEEVIANGQRAVEVAPDSGQVALIFAQALLNIQEYEAALAQLDRAASLGAPRGNLLQLRANAHEWLDDYPALIDDLEGLLALGDPDPFTNLRLAAAYLLTGDPRAALRAVSPRVVSAPAAGFTAYPAYAAYVAYRAGDLELAQTWLAEAQAQEDERPVADYVAALVAIETGDPETAIQHLEGLQDTPTWQYDYPFLNPALGHHPVADLARAQHAAGQTDTALATLDAAIQAEQYIAILFETRANIYLDMGRTDRGLHNLTFALILANNSGLWARVRDQLFARGADDTLLVAYQMVDSFNTEAALKLLDDARVTFPETWHFRWLEGRALLYNGDGEFARALGEGLISDNPDNPAGHLILADYFQQTGEFDSYQDALAQAQALAPEDPYLLVQVAGQLKAEGQYVAALTAFNRAESQGLPPVILWLERGFFAYEIERYDIAARDLAALAEVEGHGLNNDAIFALVGSHLLLGQDQAALEAIRFYQDKPVAEWEAAEYNASLAYAAARTGDRELRASLVQRAQDVDPEVPQLAYLQGAVALRTENYEQAIETFQAIQAAYPNEEYAYPYFNPRYGHDLVLDLARAYEGLGNAERALALYDIVISSHGDWVLPYIERARLYADLGRTEEARADLDTALTLTIDPAQEARIRRALEALNE